MKRSHLFIDKDFGGLAWLTFEYKRFYNENRGNDNMMSIRMVGKGMELLK